MKQNLFANGKTTIMGLWGYNSWVASLGLAQTKNSMILEHLGTFTMHNIFILTILSTMYTRIRHASFISYIFFDVYNSKGLRCLQLQRGRSLTWLTLLTDYGRPVRKLPSLHSWKSTYTPKVFATAEAYFVRHIGPNFQISLIWAFIGCP